ncbi:MAG: starch synthase [Gammaproteobacteria bacterium]|nr:MAG: starch synthase [Gammaproteobacteria bacterium]
MKVLFLASEKEGLVKTGGLADVVRALPAHLKRQGIDVRVMIPCYRDLLVQNYSLRIPSLDIHLTHHDCYGSAIRQTLVDDVQVYLLEHNAFFDRGGLYNEDGGDSYNDNALRFALLCKGALCVCDTLDWIPDIVHCNDWQTALAPFYLKEHFAGNTKFSHTKTVLTIHNGLFQGHAPAFLKETLGINDYFFVPEIFEDNGQINMLKGGIALADAVTTVSPGYHDELLNKETSHGLWQSYHAKGSAFVGILNGCNYEHWDPEVDPDLPENYGIHNIAGKAGCKYTLQKALGLDVESPAAPLFGIVSRLSDQKGFQYLVPALWRYYQMAQSDTSVRPIQLAVLGSGDQWIAGQLRLLADQFPESVSFTQGYSESLAHQIEAGSDYFLMPSAFEPCGLNQLYSLKYGAVPIVRSTGGLCDTVVGLTRNFTNQNYATGISFEQQTDDECFEAIQLAVTLWYDHFELYQAIQKRGMEQDFSWRKPTEEFIRLYQKLLAH